MAGHDSEIVVWQWNCCGSKRKKAVLQQFLRSHPNKPHVILLQETLAESVSLSVESHSLYGQGKRGICTLVSKNFTFIIHSLFMDHSKTEHSLIDLIPSGHLKDSLFILHIYSSPRDMRQRFTSLISKAAGKAARSPRVVAGDFNAPDQAWGYHRVKAKGADLWQAASDYGLTLVTDPSFPTRTGNFCSRDTTLDLAFVAKVGPTFWCNLNDNLGSDHCLLAMSLVVRKRPPKEFRITDWDLFRKIREE